MDLSRLDEPFDPDDIEWRAARCGKKNSGDFWVLALAYITNRAIMKRLDDVCGKGGWRNEYRDIPSGGVECGLSIKIGEEWITKWDAADETQIEGTKGGRSSAMKRAGAQWGIGRYLYGLTEFFGVVCQNGVFNGQTKNKERFKWNPPALPEWALPPEAQPDHEGIAAWCIQLMEAANDLDQLTKAKKQFSKQYKSLPKEWQTTVQQAGKEQEERLNNG